MILFWGLNVRFARQQFFYRWRKKIGQAGGIIDSKAFLGLRDLAIIATFPLSCVLFESEKLASVISSFSTFAILIISIYIPSLFSFSVSWKNIVIWIIYTGHICLNFYPSRVPYFRTLFVYKMFYASSVGALHDWKTMKVEAAEKTYCKRNENLEFWSKYKLFYLIM